MNELLFKAMDIEFPPKPYHIERGLAHYAVHSVVPMHVVLNEWGQDLYRQDTSRGNAFRLSLITNMSTAEATPHSDTTTIKHNQRECFTGRQLDSPESVESILRSNGTDMPLAGIRGKQDILIHRAHPAHDDVHYTTLPHVAIELLADSKFQEYDPYAD